MIKVWVEYNGDHFLVAKVKDVSQLPEASTRELIKNTLLSRLEKRMERLREELVGKGISVKRLEHEMKKRKLK